MFSHQLFQDRESRQGNKITQVLEAGRQEKMVTEVLGELEMLEALGELRKNAVPWHGSFETQLVVAEAFRNGEKRGLKYIVFL